jgi:toxin ParE1/3/4
MRVRWTEAAARDLTTICDYIQTNSGAEAARQVALRIYEPLSLLLQFPQMGRSGKKNGTRELTIRGLPFLAVYRLGEEVIEIVRILHGAQKWP